MVPLDFLENGVGFGYLVIMRYNSARYVAVPTTITLPYYIPYTLFIQISAIRQRNIYYANPIRYIVSREVGRTTLIPFPAMPMRPYPDRPLLERYTEYPTVRIGYFGHFMSFFPLGLDPLPVYFVAYHANYPFTLF